MRQDSRLEFGCAGGTYIKSTDHFVNHLKSKLTMREKGNNPGAYWFNEKINTHTKKQKL